MTEISFEGFQRLDLRIGKIISAGKIEGSRNLIKMQVDFGSEQRQAVAGLAQHYKPGELTGKKCAFILNLKPKKIMGVESQCMILAAEDGKGNIALLKPEKEVEVGSEIR